MRNLTTTLCLTFAVLLGSVGNSESAFAENNLFVQIKLKNGISFVLPRNWKIIDNNTKTTLEASVASRIKLPINTSLPFAANLYNHKNSTVAMVNVRIYPEMDVYQRDVSALNKQSVNDFDKELKINITDGVRPLGIEVTNWYGTKIVRINGKFFLSTQYRRTSAIDPLKYFRVNLVRLLDGKHSYTLTVSYEEGSGYLLKPIIEKIRHSIKSP